MSSFLRGVSIKLVPNGGACYAPPVIRTSSLQVLPLTGLAQGVTYHLVLTGGVGGASTLGFYHLDDTTLHVHPLHAAKAQAAVVLTDFVCPSPNMVLSFAAAPAGPYRLSVLAVTSPEY